MEFHGIPYSMFFFMEFPYSMFPYGIGMESTPKYTGIYTGLYTGIYTYCLYRAVRILYVLYEIRVLIEIRVYTVCRYIPGMGLPVCVWILSSCYLA